MTYPAVILAGGRSSRMGGGDKCLLPLGGSTILQKVIDAIAVQADAVVINSNSDPRPFALTGLDIIPDLMPERAGPLAGIHAAMNWALTHRVPYVLTVASDTPFLPRDLMSRLSGAATDIPVIAASGERLHPVIGLWPTSLVRQLEGDLHRGTRRVRSWLQRVGFVIATFGDEGAFWNINTFADYAACARWVSADPGELIAGNPREGTRHDA